MRLGNTVSVVENYLFISFLHVTSITVLQGVIRESENPVWPEQVIVDYYFEIVQQVSSDKNNYNCWIFFPLQHIATVSVVCD